MAERSSNHGLRWAAGIALAAAGATTIYDRVRRGRAGGAPAGASRRDEFAMGRGAPRGPVDLKSKQAGYELADTNVRNLVVIMVVSIVIMAVGVAGVFAMFASFDRHFIAQSATDTKEQRAAIVPPLPHLQADPYREIDATLMEQTRQLTTYGWNEEARASAHIPIERAMRRVVGKPLDAPVGQDAAGQDLAGQGSAGPAGTSETVPSAPGLDAAIPRNKPADHVQGEGRPGAVAPSYDPATDKPGEK